MRGLLVGLLMVGALACSQAEGDRSAQESEAAPAQTAPADDESVEPTETAQAAASEAPTEHADEETESSQRSASDVVAALEPPLRIVQNKATKKQGRTQFERGAAKQIVGDYVIGELRRGKVLVGSIVVTVFVEDLHPSALKGFVNGVESELGGKGKKTELAGETVTTYATAPPFITYDGHDYYVLMAGGPKKTLESAMSQIIEGN